MENRKIFTNFLNQYYHAKKNKSEMHQYAALGMIMAFNKVILELYGYDSKEYRFINKFVNREIMAGRPKKEDKKIQIGIKLPPSIIEWLRRQPESNAKLIENALTEYYQIPEESKKDNKKITN